MVYGHSHDCLEMVAVDYLSALKQSDITQVTRVLLLVSLQVLNMAQAGRIWISCLTSQSTSTIPSMSVMRWLTHLKNHGLTTNVRSSLIRYLCVSSIRKIYMVQLCSVTHRNVVY